jgi:hypothetical protein
MSGYMPSYLGWFPLGTEIVRFAVTLRAALWLTQLPASLTLHLKRLHFETNH